MLRPFDSLQVDTIFHHFPQWAAREQDIRILVHAFASSQLINVIEIEISRNVQRESYSFRETRSPPFQTVKVLRVCKSRFSTMSHTLEINVCTIINEDTLPHLPKSLHLLYRVVRRVIDLLERCKSSDAEPSRKLYR